MVPTAATYVQHSTCYVVHTIIFQAISLYVDIFCASYMKGARIIDLSTIPSVIITSAGFIWSASHDVQFQSHHDDICNNVHQRSGHSRMSAQSEKRCDLESKVSDVFHVLYQQGTCFESPLVAVMRSSPSLHMVISCGPIRSTPCAAGKWSLSVDENEQEENCN